MTKMSCVLPTLLAHLRCCPGTEREVTNIVQQRSKNTVPIKEHSRLKRMDLKQRQTFKHSFLAQNFITYCTCILIKMIL